jgi:type IV secretory pathway VirB2 component (pilin)
MFGWSALRQRFNGSSTVQNSLSGPVAKAVGIIAIVITGLGFAFAEGGSAMRKGIGIVFGLAIAFAATTRRS